jgi:hypothetical protein
LDQALQPTVEKLYFLSVGIFFRRRGSVSGDDFGWSKAEWEKALPKLKDADRLPDPSTVRRWSSGLDSSQVALSFLSQTVTRVAHWLTRSRQADGEAGPLRWIIPVLQNLWPLRL